MDFLISITSWLPIIFYRNNLLISRFPKSNRIKITSVENFEKNKDDLITNWLDYDLDISPKFNCEKILIPDYCFHGF